MYEIDRRDAGRVVMSGTSARGWTNVWQNFGMVAEREGVRSRLKENLVMKVGKEPDSLARQGRLAKKILQMCGETPKFLEQRPGTGAGDAIKQMKTRRDSLESRGSAQEMHTVCEVLVARTTEFKLQE